MQECLPQIKTLANCKPTEFLKQVNKIRKAVSNWLTVTDIMNIRSRMPKYEAPADATVEEKAEAFAQAKRKQAIENLNMILEAMLEDHPDETLEVLAYCCFIEPEDIDNHEVREYLMAYNELISDEAVISFFISLAQLGQIGSSDTAKT